MALPKKNRFSKELMGERVIVQHKNGILKEIAQESGLTLKVCKKFMKAFTKVIFKHISELKIVEIPFLCHIGPIIREEYERTKRTVKVKGVNYHEATPDQIDERQVLVPKRFQCAIKLKRGLQKFYIKRNKEESKKTLKKMITLGMISEGDENGSEN